jgi:hypothetical protein
LLVVAHVRGGLKAMASSEAQAMPTMQPTAAARTVVPLTSAATFWLVASLTVIVLFSLAQASLPVLVVYLMFGVLGALCVRLLGVTERLLFLVVYGSAVVAAVALYLYYESLYGVPYFLRGSDELHYEEVGLAFAQTLDLFDYIGIRGNLVPVWHNSVGYIYVVGVLDKFALLFGEAHTMVPRLFNAAMLGLTAVGIYRIARKLELPPRVAIACGLFAGCLPLMQYVSVQTLRDISATTLLVGIVAVWTMERDRPPAITKAALWTLLLVVLLLDLRRAQAFVAVLIAGAGFLSTDVGRRPVVWVLTGFAAALAGVGAYLVLGDVINTDVLFFLGQSDYYNDYRVDEVGGGLSSVVFTTPPPLGWLLRTAYALASPFPEVSVELDKLWLNVGTITQMMFIPFLFAGLGVAARRRQWWTVLAAMILLFIGMAMFTFQGRHIVQYLPFAVLLTALGYERYRAKRAVIFTVTAAVGGVLAVVYLLLKIA